MSYSIIGGALAFTLLAGCGGEQTTVVQSAHSGEAAASDETTATSDEPAVDEITRNYARLHLVTKHPVHVDPQLAMLCVGISQQHVDDAKKRAGPHAHTAVRIFMNDSAAGAFHKSAAYPVGSVIVKEKHGLEYQVGNSSPQASAKTRDGVGGMIKRAPGYDPAHGDWEYFYFEVAAKIERGRISSCVECHQGASASDYVFGDWAIRPQSTQRRLFM